MRDFLTALALVLVIEGILWALFPEGMKRAAAMAVAIDSSRLRAIGMLAAVIGVLGVWMIRG